MLSPENRRSRNWLEWKLRWAKIIEATGPDISAHITGLQTISAELNANTKYSMAYNDNVMGHLTNLSGHSNCTSETRYFALKSTGKHIEVHPSGNISCKDWGPEIALFLRWPSGSRTRFKSEDSSRNAPEVLTRSSRYPWGSYRYIYVLITCVIAFG